LSSDFKEFALYIATISFFENDNLYSRVSF